MQDPIKELKVRAQLLQRSAQKQDPEALARLRTVRELAALSDGELAGQVQRKHCLGTVAREAGFRDYDHACRVLQGDPQECDYGTLLYGRRCHGTLNHWFADVDEARAQQRETGGVLLPYKRQFVLVPPSFLQALGLDLDDPDLARVGADWSAPRDVAARGRLYARVLTAD